MVEMAGGIVGIYNRWRDWSKELDQKHRTVAAMITTSLLLVLPGQIMASLGKWQLTQLLIFVAVSIAAFHFAFWKVRFSTDETALKAVDYVYLGMAMFGILGVLDVQSGIAKARIPYIITMNTARIMASNTCTDKLPDCEHEMSIVRYITEGQYRHSLLGYVLTNPPSYLTPQLYAERKEFYQAVNKFYEEMSTEVFNYTDEVEKNETDRRIFGYYLLVIGLSLRITKVTAEVLKWHLPKGANLKRTDWDW